MSFLNSNEFYLMPKTLYIINQAIVAIYYIILSLVAWIGIVHNGDSGEVLDNKDLIHYKILHTNDIQNVQFQNMDLEMASEYAYLNDIVLPKTGTVHSINPYRKPHQNKKSQKM